MQLFKDNTGDEWHVDLNLGHILQIEAYDFTQALHKPEEEGPTHIQFFPPDEELFTTLVLQSAVCFSMIWCAVRAEAEQRNITNELEFAKRFNGDTMAAARKAFLEELANFFPEMRTTLMILIEKFSAMTKMVDEKLSKKTEEMLGSKMEAVIDEEIAKLSLD